MCIISSFRWIRRFALQPAFVGLALVLMLSLAACGGGSSSSSGSTSSGPVNLTIWSWVTGIDKSVALWNSSHPNIQVKLANVGAGPTEYNKLYTAIKANNEPRLSSSSCRPLRRPVRSSTCPNTAPTT